MITKAQQLAGVHNLLSKLADVYFYGQLHVEMQNGNIVRVVQIQSIKPEDFPNASTKDSETNTQDAQLKKQPHQKQTG